MTKKVTTERRTAITILKIKKTPNIGKQINTGVSNRTVPLCCERSMITVKLQDLKHLK
jgi:hypothetical protein